MDDGVRDDGAGVLVRDRAPTAEELDRYRGELVGYCYRMLGSAPEAEDAVQDAMAKAWRARDGFEGRASVRSWLYRIAHNTCLDVLRTRPDRIRPVDMGPAGSAADGLPAALPEERWLTPVPDGALGARGDDPAELASQRDTVRLAFVAALQHLPPRQRAVLVLREVLAWPAAEVADLLDSTVGSVNSALQRARATLAHRQVADTDVFDPLDASQQVLLDRYVEAFEAYDLDALTSLMAEDVVQSMPPYDLWLVGHDELRAWYLGTGIGCRGSRLVATTANGSPAYGQYKPDPDGGFAPWALQVLEIRDGRVVHVNSFLDTPRLFPLFGLPDHLPAD